jgi:very-short-patch-repair endonuclease
VTPAQRKPRFNEADIRAILTRQLGLITSAQATDAGMSESARSRRVQSGEWDRPLPRVYRDALSARTPEQAAFAAQMWAGSDSVICFAAAGVRWRLDGLRAKKPELWVPGDRAPKSELVIVHRGDVDLNDRRMLGPITLTSPRPPGGKGRPGSGRLREILEDRGSQRAAMSRLEVRIWRVLRAKGLTPVRQHPVRCGDTTYWIDCAFPQSRVSVEGFGDTFHRGARQRKRELRRLGDLATMQWRVLPVTWEDITDAPDDVVARIVGTLAA